MPASRDALALTQRYRAAQVAIRQRALLLLAQAWRMLAPDDFDRSFAAFLPVAVALVTQAQAQAAALSPAYLAAYLTAEYGEPQDAPTVSPSQYAGQSDVPLPLALGSGLVAMKLAVLANRDPLVTGFARVAKVADTEVAQAGRRSLRDLMDADERVIGWRRVTSGSGCAACQAAATGAIRKTDEVPDVHPYCSCTASPVLRGVRERVGVPHNEVDDLDPSDAAKAITH